MCLHIPERSRKRFRGHAPPLVEFIEHVYDNTLRRRKLFPLRKRHIQIKIAILTAARGCRMTMFCQFKAISIFRRSRLSGLQKNTNLISHVESGNRIVSLAVRLKTDGCSDVIERAAQQNGQDNIWLQCALACRIQLHTRIATFYTIFLPNIDGFLKQFNAYMLRTSTL